ncbi:MAG: twin-arginine translocation signal domain-containing protein, partial [Micrococcales bacterium]|nr:twin-arginine translocation signal domain-containing protein [Micrococcales bacterium]
MPGLSRRHFLTGVAALAAATGLNVDVLGRGLRARRTDRCRHPDDPAADDPAGRGHS